MYISPQIVVGYHGCDQSIFDSVIKNGEHLKASKNDYDWLGEGIYFWEGSYERAKDWATNNRKVNTPAVVGAFIKLGNCFDLLDSKHIKDLKVTYQVLEQEYNSLKLTLPSNSAFQHGISFNRKLDCLVLLRLQQINNQGIAKELNLKNIQGANSLRKIRNHEKFIDSIRGMFPEGNELYPNAGFRDKNHIQLCVVNPNCIIGYFDPKQRNYHYKAL